MNYLIIWPGRGKQDIGENRKTMTFANILPEYLETQGFCQEPGSVNQKVKEIKQEEQGLCHHPTNDSQGMCWHPTDDSQTGGK